MRITFVLPYAGMAGGIRVLAIYALRLQERGHQVTVISTSWRPPGRRARAWGRLRRFMQRLHLRPEHRREPSHFDGLNIEHVQIREVRPVTEADVPDGDVVVATWWETAAWVARFSQRKGAKAYFVQDYGAHGGQPMDEVARTWLLPLHQIVISKWLMHLIEERCGKIDADYVPNAVDLKQFHAPPRGKQRRLTVGFLYNTAPQKGCDTILKAIELASKTVRDLHVVAYGLGNPVPRMPLPAGSDFWSFAPDEKLKEIYSACDAWLFGSRLEGFGLPILEAMACRTPVIATPAGAAPELVGEGGGILVKPDDAHDMSRAIQQIASMPEPQWREMSDAAFTTASRYTWDDATDLFEAALQRAIAKSKQGALTVV